MRLHSVASGLHGLSSPNEERHPKGRLQLIRNVYSRVARSRDKPRLYENIVISPNAALACYQAGKMDEGCVSSRPIE